MLLLAFAAAFAAVLLSGSRSIWGVMIVLAVVLLLICRSRVAILLKGRLLALAGIAILIVILASGVIVERFEALWQNMDKLTEGGDYNSSLGLRVAVWKIGLQLVAEDPLFGHGMQNVSALIREGVEQNFGIQVGFTHFHNGFLTILVEGGIVAGLAIIAMFALITVIAVRSLAKAGDRLERLGGAVLLMLAAVYAGGGTVNLIFGHDILDTVFMIFLIIGLFLARGTSRLADAEAPAPFR
ncbi:O-antigen ligase family protein [Nitratireductor aquibiodomus]|uniref:O-antigen ligase family protein n=1 Tax=Nitratireductor aquibiodomus TaxID=204799 RepID=UPI001FCC2FC0|nr:O-antigen ligase family protein [Nitratireductor aquibiodomus]